MDIIYVFIKTFWSDVVKLLQDFTTYILDHLLIWGLDLIIYFATYAFDLFTNLVSGLSLDVYLSNAVSELSPTVGFVFLSLKIGTYIQVVVSAHVTRIILKMSVPGL